METSAKVDLHPELGLARLITVGASGDRVSVVVIFVIRFQKLCDALWRDVLPGLPRVVIRTVPVPFY